MRDIVTEDIVRNALNESIDEFMLEEGMLGNGFKGLQNWWNNGNGQKIKNGLSNAWNGYKNFMAMYMDNKTNGQWNRKYGIYANGNTKTGELLYLNKWLNYYKEKLNSIIYQANSPDRRDEYDLYEKDPDTGKEYMKRNRYDFTGINGALEYAKLYCTPQNFNDYIKSLNPDRESVWHINTFIQNYINNEAKKGNLKAVLNNLSIYVFYTTNEFQQYIAMNRQKQQEKEKQKRINNSNKQNTNQPNPKPKPLPTNSDGTFEYDENALRPDPKYPDWVISKDKNGKNILVNTKNPSQAVFY